LQGFEEIAIVVKGKEEILLVDEKNSTVKL
jgi:hypothetical protein